MLHAVDPVELTQRLIRCPSVTPKDEGAISVLIEELTRLGFRCQALAFGSGSSPLIQNLVAQIGDGSRPHFCFAAHTDVVAPKDDQAPWRFPPFSASIDNGRLYGRGAEDMKGGLACAIAAVSRHLASRREPMAGTITFAVTGDEEGSGQNGMPKVVEWMAAHDLRPDGCILPEPSSRGTLGSTLKIGSRGCLDAVVVVDGIQGHTAYPADVLNPIHLLVPALTRISQAELDQGTDQFEPTSVQVVTVDVGNQSHNVVPGRVTAVINIRFTDRHTPESLRAWLKSEFNRMGHPYQLTTTWFNTPYLTSPGPFIDFVQRSVREVLGVEPRLITSGGASDARVLQGLCPTVELGLVHRTSHKVDEFVPVEELQRLTDVFTGLLDHWFSSAASGVGERDG